MPASASPLTGKSVLVTGGTGSIGSELCREVLRHRPKRLIVFSRDDSKQFYLQQEFRGRDEVQFMIGDVRDRESLARAFGHDVDTVLHAAALKHVAICEQNPTEAVKTNILGTQNMIDLAVANDVERVITISTDKAVNPSCTMGATKYIAEKLTVTANGHSREDGPVFACVRFGNVLGSRGSVIPAFLHAVQKRNAITVSDPEVTRFAITVQDAASLVLDALRLAEGGEIFVLKMGAFRLGTLVDVFRDLGLHKDPPTVTVAGLSPGEKLHEDLITSEELVGLLENDRLYAIRSNRPGSDHARSDLRPSSLRAYTSATAPLMSSEVLRGHVTAAMGAPRG